MLRSQPVRFSLFCMAASELVTQQGHLGGSVYLKNCLLTSELVRDRLLSLLANIR